MPLYNVICKQAEGGGECIEEVLAESMDAAHAECRAIGLTPIENDKEVRYRMLLIRAGRRCWGPPAQQHIPAQDLLVHQAVAQQLS